MNLPFNFNTVSLVATLLVAGILACSNEADHPPVAEPVSTIPVFTNVAREAMGGAYRVSNYRPGVAIFDYDRDGDQDIYLTQEAGHPNRLFRNDGELTFVETAESAGVAAVEQGSSGVVACDLNNDGYQDLYVGGRGIQGDGLDFRSAHVVGEDGRPIAAHTPTGSLSTTATALSQTSAIPHSVTARTCARRPQ